MLGLLLVLFLKQFISRNRTVTSRGSELRISTQSCCCLEEEASVWGEMCFSSCSCAVGNASNPADPGQLACFK